MGPVQRRVWEKGRRARQDGKDMRTNPYYGSEGSWGARCWDLWAQGWEAEDEKDAKAILVSKRN